MRLPVAALLLSMAATGCATKADVDAMRSSVQTDLEEIRAGQRILLAQIRGGLDSLDAAGVRRETTGRGEFERRVGRLEDLFDQVLEITEQNNQRLNDLYEAQVSRSSAARRAPMADAEPSRAAGKYFAQNLSGPRRIGKTPPERRARPLP